MSDIKSIEYCNMESINNKFYDLIFYENNSAPCSQCAFLERTTLKCKHPNVVERKCSCEIGTVNGWNTWEYKFVPKIFIKIETIIMGSIGLLKSGVKPCLKVLGKLLKF